MRLIGLGHRIGDPVVELGWEAGAVSLDEVEEELTVAFRSRQPRVYDPGRLGPPCKRGLSHLERDAPSDLRISDDAAACIRRADLELRLDEDDGLPPRCRELQERRQSFLHADERDVADDERGRKRELRHLPGVRSLPYDDAWIVSDTWVQLAVADVESDHARGSSLEQDVREPAGGGSDVEAIAPGRVDAKRFKGLGKLDPASRDVRLPLRHRKLGAVVHLLARLRMSRNAAGEDEGLGLRPALRKPALDKEEVDSFLHAPMIAVVTELEGERVRLRPLEPADVEPLAVIGAEREVARWWGEITQRHLLDKAEGRDDATAFAIEYEGEVVGLAQFSEPGEDEFKHANIDLFLTSPLRGRGLGRDAVRTLARWLIDERGHHRLTIDPALTNEPAIRAYEAVGFKRVGVLRRYWRDPEGVWQDGLLLDLLADEL
jgi:aminoglycoside 6'-N-acetyltransferase